MFWNHAWGPLQGHETARLSTGAEIAAVSFVRKHFERSDDWHFLAWNCDLDLTDPQKPLRLHVLEQWLNDTANAKLKDDRGQPRQRLLLIETVPGEFSLLLGTGVSVSTAVRDAGGLRGDPEVIKRYLTFFCACLLSDNGNFVVVNRIGRLIVEDARRLFERVRQQRLDMYLGTDAQSVLKGNLTAIEEAVKPFRALLAPPSAQAPPDAQATPEDYAEGFAISVTQPRDGRHEYRCECVVLYATAAFKATLTVNAATGEIDMVDDEPIRDLGQAVTTWHAQRGDGYPWFVDPHGVETPAPPETAGESKTKAPATTLERALEEFRSTGRLENMWIGGDLVIDGQELGERCEVVLDNLVIEGDLRFACNLSSSVVIRGCSVLGRLLASGLRIRGNVSVVRSEVWGLPVSAAGKNSKPQSRPPAIDFERLHVEGSLDMMRVTAWGGVNAYQCCIDAHANLSGLWMLTPFVEVGSGSGTQVRRSLSDRYQTVSFEQARIAGTVNLSPDVARAGNELDKADRPRSTVVVGFMTFRDAKVGQSMCIMGLTTVSVRKDKCIHDIDPHPSWQGLSLRGIEIGGSLTSYLSDTVQHDLRNDRLVFRCVIGGDLDMHFAQVDGVVDLRGVQVEGVFRLSGSRCIQVSLAALPLREIDEASRPETTPLEAYLGPHEIVVNLSDDERLPVAHIKGALTIKNSVVEAGVSFEGTLIDDAVEISGGKIGGIQAEPFVAGKELEVPPEQPPWKRPRFASFRAHEVEFTRRIALYGVHVGNDASNHPRPAIEFLHCFVNGGISLHDRAIHDDRASIREKGWAYRWAGVREPTKERAASERLDGAERNRMDRRDAAEVPALDRVVAEDALAAVVLGDLCIVNCELDGDFDFTNAMISGKVRLNDSVVRADVRAVPLVKEPPGPAYYPRSAVCRELNVESLQCEGDLKLAGLRLAAREPDKSHLKARNLRVTGELRLALSVRAYAAKPLMQFSSTAAIDLTDARVGRLVLPLSRNQISLLALTWRLDGFTTGAYSVESESGSDSTAKPSKAVVAWMRKARFNPQVYLDYERALVQSGHVTDADRVYRTLRWRQWRGQSWVTDLLKKPWVLAGGVFLGFGTALWRPILIWLLSFLVALAAVWRREDVQPSLSLISATPLAERRLSVDASRSACPDDWTPFERVALAIRYAVPIVAVFDESEWEPREAARSSRCPRPAQPPQRPLGRTDFMPPSAPDPAAGPETWALGWAHRGIALALGGVAEGTARVCRPLNRLLRQHKVTPKQTTSGVRILNWLLIPWFLAGITVRIQRRRS